MKPFVLAPFVLASCMTIGDLPGQGSGAGSDMGTGSDPGSGSNPGTPSARRIVAYFASWDVYARNYNISDIPADLVTVVNYAFLNIANGECVLGDSYADTDKLYPGDTDASPVKGNFHQLQLLKQAHPQLKVLLSVGGWTWSTNFSDVAATDASRATFAKSCAALVATYGFDGLDVDWEYPGGGGLAAGRPEDTQNYTKLLAALRTELGTKLLTIAAPAGSAQIAKIDVASVAAVVDWINVMTYDFHGAFEMTSNFDAPLPDVATALQAWRTGGAPAAKLVAGMPLYGYGWNVAAATNDGMNQTATSIPMGTWAQGNFDYKDIVANYLPTMTRHFSPTAKSPWLYDPARSLVIAYDDAESLTAKTDLVRDMGLGGAMFWELSSDDAQHTLVRAVHDELLR